MHVVDAFFNYRNMFVINEVVRGRLEFRSNHKKHETTVRKALEYTLSNNVLSHWSLQKYNNYLGSRKRREESDETYYPFVIEFESSINYRKAVQESVLTYHYILEEFNVWPSDILIMATPGKSIYLYINPKIYDLKPSNRLSRIYGSMASELKRKLQLTTVDMQLYGYNRLVKTPNSFYKGGYVVPISGHELEMLHAKGEPYKTELVRKRRPLNYDTQCEPSDWFTDFYNKHRIKVKQNHENTKQISLADVVTDNETLAAVLPIKRDRKCVDHILKYTVPEGSRNRAIVSVAIDLMLNGFDLRQAIILCGQVNARSGSHFSKRHLESIVKTIFKNSTQFSCEKAREVLGDSLPMCKLCSQCGYNCLLNRDKDFYIHAQVINDLFKNNASTRHYRAYITLAANKLLNVYFSTSVIEKLGLNKRVIRDLIKLTDSLSLDDQGTALRIQFRGSSKGYLLPMEFYNADHYLQLGRRLNQFLKFLTFGYKQINKGLLVTQRMKTILQIFNFEERAYYTMLQKFVDLGFIKTLKNNSFALYFIPEKEMPAFGPGDREDAEIPAAAGAEKQHFFNPDWRQQDFYFTPLGSNISVKNPQKRYFTRGSPP